jgi:intermediate cleaving peptidase 55
VQYIYDLINPSPLTEKNSSPRGFRMILYSTGKDPSTEKWDGASTRFADVVSFFGADDARPLDNLADDLRALVARAEHVYVDLPAPAPNSTHHSRQYRHRRRVVGAGTTTGTKFPFFKYLSRQYNDDNDPHAAETGGSYMDVLASSVSMSKRKPLTLVVGALRSVKSECEVEVMKASAEISARAHAKVSFGVLGRNDDVVYLLTVK